MPMTASSFRAWREHMGVTKAQAGRWLGTSERTIHNYEAGFSPVPHAVSLACAALSLGIRDYNGIGDSDSGGLKPT